MEVLVRKTSKEARLPSYAHQGDAGLDIYSLEDKKVKPNAIEMIETGISVQIPEGFVGIMKDKSGIAVSGMHCLAGVIDSSYRGEIKVLVINHGQKEYIVRKGEKIAQLIIHPVAMASIKEAKELEESSRGEKGFGSTGLV